MSFDYHSVDENGTPLWWIDHPSRKWFEVYKRIGELEARVAELEGSSAASPPDACGSVRLDPGQSGQWGC